MQVVRREEDECIEPRHADLLDRLLCLQESDQGQGLAIGEQDRTVLTDCPALVLASPRSSITRNTTGPALDFDQPESLFGQDQKIDLVDRTLVGLEFEIGPRPVRVVIGQSGADKIETAPFPLVLGRRDDVPAWRFHLFFRPSTNDISNR